MMLMLWFFHTVYVAADWMVMPLCLSSSMESIVAPTPSFPFTCTPHGRKTAHECGTVPTCKTSPDGSAYLMNLCYPAGVVEDTLGQGGLPRVDVGWDSDVADPVVGKDPVGTCPAAVDEHLWRRNRERSIFNTLSVCLPIVKCKGLMAERLGWGLMSNRFKCSHQCYNQVT